MANVFADVNARASILGAKLMMQAIENNELETIQTLHALVVEMYETLIEMVKTKPDYPTWHNALLKLNRDNPFHQLDTTGEFTKLVEELAEIDATGYYFETIMPLIKEGAGQFIAERDQMVHVLTGVEKMIIEKRRPKLTIV